MLRRGFLFYSPKLPALPPALSLSSGLIEKHDVGPLDPVGSQFPLLVSAYSVPST